MWNLEQKVAHDPTIHNFRDSTVKNEKDPYQIWTNLKEKIKFGRGKNTQVRKSFYLLNSLSAQKNVVFLYAPVVLWRLPVTLFFPLFHPEFSSNGEGRVCNCVSFFRETFEVPRHFFTEWKLFLRSLLFKLLWVGRSFLRHKLIFFLGCDFLGMLRIFTAF